MTEDKYIFPKGKWIVNIRRLVQGTAFFLFFFLLFNTQKTKNLEIPILIYGFVFLIVYLIYLLVLTLIKYYRGKHFKNINLKKIIIVSLITVLLGLVLNYYHQFSKPERLNYIKDNSNTITQDIAEYKNARKKYDPFREYTTIKTHISEKTDANVQIILPPLLILLNNLLLVISFALLIYSNLLKYRKINTEKIKPYLTLSICFIIFTLITTILLDFDFKTIHKNYSGDTGYILNIIPTDFTHYYYYVNIPQNVFLKSSSLLGSMSSIALQSFAISIGFILFFLIISLIFGRVFCGWICPFGTFHQIISFFKMKFQKYYDHEVYLKKQRIKYIIFAIIFASAIFSINFSGFLDPISVVTKSAAIFLVPATQLIVTKSYDQVHLKAKEEIKNNGGFFTLLDNLYRPVKDYLEEYVFYFSEPLEVSEGYVPTHYAYFFVNAFILLLLIGLNLKSTRFWCRVICPLGAMLGIFANRSLMRIQVNDNCTACGDCEKFCQGAADVSIKNGFKTSECMYCFNCMNICPHNALDVQWTTPVQPQLAILSFKNTLKKVTPLPRQKLDLSKRTWAASFGVGILSYLGFRSSLWEKRSSPLAIRPPGSVKEEDFLRKCIKCSECMKVCPKNFLHPAFLETGIEGMFTPIGIGKLGYCEHTCNACGQVCPTQAIQKLPLYKKQELRIGLAVIRKDKCLTYASQTPCIVCEEHCPTSPKAIWTEKVTFNKKMDGKIQEITIDQIRVEPKHCIGCAICEYVCPVVDEPAIYVSSIQESRSKENQMLLS